MKIIENNMNMLQIYVINYSGADKYRMNDFQLAYACE